MRSSRSTRLNVWPPLPPSIYIGRRSGAPPFPLADPRCRLYSLGRHALWQGVKAAGLAPGDEILVPAYHHGSEVEALVGAGLSCRFYAGTTALAPDGDELDALLGERTRALLLIHYLGFPQDAAHWKQWCEQRGLLLLEDAAQAWLAATSEGPVGSFGDVAIFCLYKTFGLPDGAALVAPDASDGEDLETLLGLDLLARRHLAWVRSRIPLERPRATGGAASAAATPEEDFALGDVGLAPARTTMVALGRVSENGVAARRRANYQQLLDRLGEIVPEPFRELPSGASPFVFPVAARAKSELLGHLAAAGIHAFDFWSIPHPSLSEEAFPAASALRREVIGLPVHQELREGDVDRISAAVVASLAGGSRRRRAEVSAHERLEDISDGWDALADECNASPFARPGWFLAWWKAFGTGKPYVAVGRRDGKTTAVLPLIGGRNGLRSATNDHTPRFGLLAKDDDSADELASWVFERRPRQVSLEYVDLDDPTSARLKAVAVGSGYRVLARPYERSPYLTTEGSWEEYERGLSGRVRRDLARRRRRLEELGPVRLDVSDGTVRRAELLAEGFRLEPSGWKAARGTAVASQENTRSFYEDLAEWAADRGWLRLSFLRVAEKGLAFQYGFEASGIYYFLKGGYDPEYSRFAPGKLLLQALLERAYTTGLRRFDFLGADDPFKLEWSQTAYDLKLLQAFSPSPLGTAEWAAFAYGRPLAGRARARLRSLR